MGQREQRTNRLEVVSIRLVKDAPILSEDPVTSPQDAVRLLGSRMCDMDREVVCVINLRADGRPINCNLASMGAVDWAVVHPREIFKSSILSNAASILMLHNHPSGNLMPSKLDNELTERIIQAGDILGIPVKDHIIVGRDNSRCYSFQAEGIIDVLKGNAVTRIPGRILKASSGDFAPDKKLNGMSRDEIETIVLFEARRLIHEQGLEARVLAARVYGSRTREGMYREDSDIDVVLLYEGKSREDDFFAALNDRGRTMGGLKLDINPIKEEKSGSLEDFLLRNEEYLDKQEVRSAFREDKPGTQLIASRM